METEIGRIHVHSSEIFGAVSGGLGGVRSPGRGVTGWAGLPRVPRRPLLVVLRMRSETKGILKGVMR